MKVYYANDLSRGAGHGYFHITDLNSLTASETLRFSIRRASDQNCLAAGDWQPAEIMLAPLHTEVTDGGIRIFVGPEVVDQLDPLETYRVTVQDTGVAPTRATLTVSDICYSPGTGGQIVGATTAPPPAPQETAPPLQPEPQEEVPLPAEEPTDPVPAEPTQEELALASPQGETPQKSGIGMKLLVMLLVLLVICGLLFYFLHPLLDEEKIPPATGNATQNATAAPTQNATAVPAHNATTPEKPLPVVPAQNATTPAEHNATIPVQPTPLSPPTPQDAPSPNVPATPASPSAPSTPAVSLKTQAHTHLKGQADPATGLGMAQQFRSQPDGADPAFLLAEDAAEKGNAEAMLMTGDYFDPTSQAPSGTIQKDPLAAWDWFSKAKAAGSPQANERLTALKAWAEKEATKGNPDAQELLRRVRQ